MGDIESMFHQIKVPESDRDYLRFLWFPENRNRQPEVYRMTVHLFGGVWSPSCASYALRRTAIDNKTSYDEEIIETVLKNFYVDDCLKSLNKEDETIDHTQKLCKLVAHGGFKLNKWISSNRDVLESIQEENRAKCVKGVDLAGEILPKERALGVLWDTEDDCLGFKIHVKNKPNTRQGLISMIASVYDPMGFVSPFILQAKKIFQEKSRLRKGWDEPLNHVNKEKWSKWVQDLPKLENFQVPRCVTQTDNVTYEFHHFSDASSEGYGAVSYLRVVNCDEQGQCSLMISKSRLAPLKQMSIPRLELSAAVISVKLDRMLRQELKLDVARSVFWTDSTIVVQYIQNEDKRFHVFVANRLTLINELSEPQQWRHVRSGDNPVDDVSRGLNAEQMVTSERWKYGPKFLSQRESDWPVSNISTKLSDSDKEVKKDAKTYTTMTERQEDLIDKLFNRYSSWYKLKRSVAWILRLKKLLYEKTQVKSQSTLQKSENVLSVDELKTAEKAIVQVLQKREYEQEYKTLEEGKPVKKSSRIYKLEPTLNADGVMCVGGRLQASSVSEERKHNMILPRETEVTKLIISNYHEPVGTLERNMSSL